MRAEGPRDNSDHIIDLLPAYINRTLDTQDNVHVQTHLQICTICQDELIVWQSIKQATTHLAEATEPAIVPALALLDKIWMEVEVPVRQRGFVPHVLGSKLVLMGQLVRVQRVLLPRGSWIALPIAIILGFIVLTASRGGSYLPEMLGFVAPVVTAAAVGFIFGPDNDPSLEIALSTPTSPRLVLLSRLLLVFGYNFAFALATTLVLVLLNGGDLSLIVSLWMGPMLLLTGLSLLLSLTVSTMSGIGSVVGLWCIHSISPLFSPLKVGVLSFNALWQTSPIILVCAIALLSLAVYCAPLQVRRHV